GHPVAFAYRRLPDLPLSAGRWQFNTASVPGFLPPGLTRVTAVFYDGPDGTGNVLHQESMDVRNTFGGTMTSVDAQGRPATGRLAVSCPSSYVPGQPFVVE